MSKKQRELLRQVLLERKTPEGTQRIRCLIDDDSRLKIGVTFPLVDSERPDEMWELVWMGQPVERIFVHREWDNNI